MREEIKNKLVQVQQALHSIDRYELNRLESQKKEKDTEINQCEKEKSKLNIAKGKMQEKLELLKKELQNLSQKKMGSTSNILLL